MPHLLSESSADGSREQGREPHGQEGRVAEPLEPGGGGPRFQPRGMGSWYLFPGVSDELNDRECISEVCISEAARETLSRFHLVELYKQELPVGSRF